MTAPTEAEVRAWLLSELAESQRFIGMDMLAGKERGNPDARREAHKLSNMLRAALALLDEARKDRERLDWYEQQHKLHGAVEVLYVYVVDEYELTITHDGNPVRYVRAPTLRAAIDQARGA